MIHQNNMLDNYINNYKGIKHRNNLMTTATNILLQIYMLIPTWLLLIIILGLITLFFAYYLMNKSNIFNLKNRIEAEKTNCSEIKDKNNKLTRVLASGIIDKHDLHKQEIQTLYDNKMIYQIDVIDQMINRFIYELKHSYYETATELNSKLAIKYENDRIVEQTHLYVTMIENLFHGEIKDQLRIMLKDSTWVSLNYDDWELYKKQKFESILTAIKSRLQDEYPTSMVVPVSERMTYFETVVRKNFMNVFTQAFDKIKEAQLKYNDDTARKKKLFVENLDEYIKNGFSF